MDYTRLDGLEAFGATGTIYTISGVDLAAGFSRQLLAGVNATTLNGSIYYTTPAQDLMVEVGYGSTWVGGSSPVGSWGLWRIGFNYRP
jgi:hypothetical protein